MQARQVRTQYPAPIANLIGHSSRSGRRKRRKTRRRKTSRRKTSRRKTRRRRIRGNVKM
tara:strand:+ start:655 stop:831 length:177 start_codon:yes stop_codon:yes gene_type:complete